MINNLRLWVAAKGGRKSLRSAGDWYERNFLRNVCDCVETEYDEVVKLKDGREHRRRIFEVEFQ